MRQLKLSEKYVRYFQVSDFIHNLHLLEMSLTGSVWTWDIGRDTMSRHVLTVDTQTGVSLDSSAHHPPWIPAALHEQVLRIDIDLLTVAPHPSHSSLRLVSCGAFHLDMFFYCVSYTAGDEIPVVRIYSIFSSRSL